MSAAGAGDGPPPDSRQRNARLFDDLAATYDDVGVAFFGPIAAGLARELALVPGERVADIGCGKGAFLLEAARAVGPTGRAVGMDISAAMVAAARSAAERGGLQGVEVSVDDAQQPSLPSRSFDVVASSLVLFFLADPAAALRAWRELLVSGGRLGIATFGPQDPTWASVDAVFTPFLPAQMLDARVSGARGPFGSDAGVATLVEEAGFVVARTHSMDLPVHFADADQWYAFSNSTGQRAMWEAVPEEERPNVRAEAERRLATAEVAAGGFVLRQQVRYTLAINPG